MESLSFLIENNNEVIVDHQLLHDLQQKSDRDLQSKSPLEKVANHRAKNLTKKYIPMNRDTKRSPQSHQLINTQASAITSLQLSSKISNQQESIELISSKIQGLKQGHKQIQQKYGNIIGNLRNQLSKQNSEYEHQCQEFSRIKSQLINTKKDIASLIGLLKQSTPKQLENNKKAQSPIGNRNSKGNNILGGHIKYGKNIG